MDEAGVISYHQSSHSEHLHITTPISYEILVLGSPNKVSIGRFSEPVPQYGVVFDLRSSELGENQRTIRYRVTFSLHAHAREPHRPIEALQVALELCFGWQNAFHRCLSGQSVERS